MAASSSDDSSSAPKDFHLSSSLDSGSRLSPNKRKCPLCCRYKKNFHCKECIRNGKFFASRLYTETLSDKQVNLLWNKEKKSILERDCLTNMEKKRNIKSLQEQIRQKKEKIRMLKVAIVEKKENQAKNKAQLHIMKKSNIELKKILPKYKSRCANCEAQVEGNTNDIIIYKQKLEMDRKKLKELALLRIKQLMKYIFPLTKKQTETEMASSNSDITSALAEATQTTYCNSKWVYNPENIGDTQYTLVAPYLPANGNYNAYNIWVTENSHFVFNPTNPKLMEQYPSFRISAGLTYTAQLVNLLAFYLDVKLPYKLCYSAFCSINMPEKNFNNLVARLNANVLHLCFSQHTNLSLLHPKQTLHNLTQLLDQNVSDLGKYGPILIDNNTADELEKQLGDDMCPNEDSDSEESDTVTYDWEAVSTESVVMGMLEVEQERLNQMFFNDDNSIPKVPHVQIPDATVGHTPQTAQTIPAQQASSVAGALMNNAAATIVSFWNKWPFGR